MFRGKRYLVVIAVLVAMLAMASTTLARESARSTIALDAPMVPGEVIVAFEPGTPEKKAAEVAEQGGFILLDYNQNMGIALFALTGGDEASPDVAMDKALDSSPDILAASPNYITQVGPVMRSDARPLRPDSIEGVALDAVTGQEIPVVEHLPPLGAPGKTASSNYPSDWYYQWGWWAINADDVFEPKGKPKAVGVAVVDTGADFKHPDLKGVKSGYDWVNEDKKSDDDNGHGTHVAGIIAAQVNNDSKKYDGGIPGIAPGVPVTATKVLDAMGFGTAWDVANGIGTSADEKAVQVINLSLGFYYPSDILELAVNWAVNVKGKLLVVSAGNDDAELDCVVNAQYPACYAYTGGSWGSAYVDGMIVVAASGYDMDESGDMDWPTEIWCQGTNIDYSTSTPYPYSNYNGIIDIAAPGTAILSTTPSYPYNGNDGSDPLDTYSGTSMAAPHVTAAAARVWGEHTDWTALQVKNQLIGTGDTITGSCWPGGDPTFPSLNLARALDRFSFIGDVYDAQTGAEVQGATVYASRLGKNVASDKMCKTCNYFKITNITTDAVDWLEFSINAKGYTKGSQPYVYGLIDDPGSYGCYGLSWDWVLPQNIKGQYHLVMPWGDGNYEPDAYLFLPPGNEAGGPGSDFKWLGPRVPWSGTSGGIYDLTGELLDYPPFARVMYDAWWGYHLFDTISLATEKTGPYYPGDYVFLATNNWDSVNGWVTPDPIGDVDGLTAYVWKDGEILYFDILGTASTAKYWIIGEINGTNFTGYNDLVTDTYTTYTGGTTFDLGGAEGGPLIGPIPPSE